MQETPISKPNNCLSADGCPKAAIYKSYIDGGLSVDPGVTHETLETCPGPLTVEVPGATGDAWEQRVCYQAMHNPDVKEAIGRYCSSTLLRSDDTLGD